MVKKITKILVLTLVLFAFVPVCVMAKTDLMTKLEDIEKEITNLKTEYTNILASHSDVVDSLSNENKEVINNLASNILSSNIAEKVNALKTELETLSKEGADDVLNAINKLEENSKKLIDENKDALNELKDNYSNLNGEELKEVAGKVKDIMVSVGLSHDSKEAHDKIITIFDDAHKIIVDINEKVDNVLKNNVNKFNETLTIEFVDKVLDALQNNDMEKVVDALLEAVNNVSKADELKQELGSIKNEIGKLENKLNEFGSIKVEDILMLSETEIKEISEKVKVIEKDYIDFTKAVINKYSDIYLKVVFNKAKNVSIDKMIEYANKSLDIIDRREDIVNDLSSNSLPNELTSKAGILVALGTVDLSAYDKEYINANFSSEFEKIATFLVDEVLDYIDSIDSAMKNEVKESVASGEPELSQDKVIDINVSRFATVENLKKLQTRVENKLLSTQEKLKEKLSKYAPRVYDIFNTNILDTIETIMSLENEKTTRAYEYNAIYNYIVTDTFVEAKDFGNLIGIPEENQDILEFDKLSESAVRTGSTLTIKLSDYVYQIYHYAVLGDVDGNCVVDSMDMYKVIQHILENSKLQNEFYRAGNTNDDSKIDSMDMYNIIQIILRK